MFQVKTHSQTKTLYNNFEAQLLQSLDLYLLSLGVGRCLIPIKVQKINHSGERWKKRHDKPVRSNLAWQDIGGQLYQCLKGKYIDLKHL